MNISEKIKKLNRMNGNKSQRWQCPKCKDITEYYSSMIYSEIYCMKCGTTRMLIDRGS